MNITFNFKNFEPSDHLRDYARKRLEKLAKYASANDASELQVNLAVEKTRQMADVIFVADNMHISAHEVSEDMYSTIDMILDKVEAQAKKFREKQKDRRRQSTETVRMDVITINADNAGARTPTIVETNEYEPKPMAVEEAAMQLGTIKHEFLVFINSETERPNVIYRLRNGDFGLIDPGTGV
ncbi:sigma 54 modulation protein/ribosomal protein S30EA [Solidesulfovibrio carbinoliphilus subsp. oakridgensis]|uniref:Ribosome hibernation promoting factor n=1 Tax=Solidesulfovibrio carbinoliphilus subsp. oakridgensis TaxID=694327 RepID=G7Q483_9BACT|nr:ribosome-associated translation inhibitor RaiA [Solidesulfovibrio carbinoliphilus]EHJ46951.1 sigma 54 modulation protein/ribosomal protein S30EA [Solidesulfovibrio carbinoliphilus subsp. oakridgensis]